MKKISFLFIVILSFTLINFSYSQNSAGSIKKYEHVSSFDGTPEETTFDGKTDITGTINYALTAAAVAIVVLVIVKVIQGAFIKGTFDNIQSQVKGKAMIQNAGLALIIFIFTYAVLSFINPRLLGWTLNTDFVTKAIRKTLNSDQGSAGRDLVCDPKAIYPNNDIVSMLLLDEGNKTSIYIDTKGNPSIGIGFNLNRADPETVKKDLMAAGVSKEDADKLVDNKDKSVVLSQDIVKKLLENDLESHKKMAIDYAGGPTVFNSLPINIQNVLINMTFNMGPGGINSFVKMKEALDAKNYYNMAKEIVDSDYCKDVKEGRCSRLANLTSPTYCADSQKSSAGSGSLTNDTLSEKSVCNKLDQVDESKMVDINTYLSGSVKCSESGANPNKCKINKDVADKLKSLDALYFQKYNSHLNVISAYRSDDYQSQICHGGKTVEGISCYTACKDNGPTGSTHSLGNAVDLHRDNVGCNKSGVCNAPQWKFILEKGKSIGLYNNYPSGENGHISTTGW